MSELEKKCLLSSFSPSSNIYSSCQQTTWQTSSGQVSLRLSNHSLTKTQITSADRLTYLHTDRQTHAHKFRKYRFTRMRQTIRCLHVVVQYVDFEEEKKA